MKITEDNFIEEIKNKNEAALLYLIDNYSYVLVNIINKNLFYMEDRKEECLNDCLLAIWENIDSYDLKRAKFTSWIGAIAKYKSMDYLRKYIKDMKIRDIDDEILSVEDDSLNNILEKEFNTQIRNLLSHLSEEDKKIFIEFYFKDSSAKEVSNQLGVKESYIYNRLSRGRKKLRLILGGRENE